MLTIGLTGGIGSGKSTVAYLFSERHIPIIDADKIARELTEANQPDFTKIVEHFGPTIITQDNQLDRKKLRLIIFADEKEKKWLEQLLHPSIQKKMQEEIKNKTASYCIAVIPLLIEAEVYSFIDRILVVDTTQDLQIERVIARDNLPRSHIETILKAQIPRTDRIAKAHDVITNNGKIDDLIPQVEKLHLFYLGLAKNADY